MVMVRTNQPPSGGCLAAQIGLFGFQRGDFQPPSGGCLAAPITVRVKMKITAQPPSGGCLAAPASKSVRTPLSAQPPSGGCLAAPILRDFAQTGKLPAAFGRLSGCTNEQFFQGHFPEPAAFGRLSGCTCRCGNRPQTRFQPPSGGCLAAQ